MSTNASSRLLQNQLQELQKNPVQGFHVELVNENNIYEWRCYVEGPPDTCYEGGIFQSILKFPKDYPYNPPTMQFTSEFYHPNVYKDGKVCISILHSPGSDPTNEMERPEERWNPVQTPETILLSVITMLADPNISSPANVDASVEWRKDRKQFEEKVKKLVEKSLKALPKDFVMPYKLHKKKEVKPISDFYDEMDDDVQIYDTNDDEEEEGTYSAEDYDEDKEEIKDEEQKKDEEIQKEEEIQKKEEDEKKEDEDIQKKEEHTEKQEIIQQKEEEVQRKMEGEIQKKEEEIQKEDSQKKEISKDEQSPIKQEINDTTKNISKETKQNNSVDKKKKKKCCIM